MHWIRKHEITSKASISRPLFVADSTEKKEIKSTERINGYYNLLEESIKKYSESEDFPQGGKYFADFKINEDDGAYTICYELRLRVRGRTVESKTFAKMWKNGVIIKKNGRE